MVVVLLSVMILLSVVAIMSVGVMFGRQPLKGSCGGMSALGMKNACDICGGEASRCEKSADRGAFNPEAEYLSYDAADSHTSTAARQENQRG